MSKYTCQRCLKDFKHKSRYEKHLARKTPCKDNRDKSQEIVNEVVEDMIKKVENKNEIIASNSRYTDAILFNNDVFVNEINQILHNAGIIMDNRLDIIMNIMNNHLYNKTITVDISNKIVIKILNILKLITIDRNEISQILFMFYCNKKTKINLDQYYTPFTIGKIMCSLMLPNKKVIDPACGTGDLVKGYTGSITLWDINDDVLNICKQNFEMNNKSYNIKCINSIENYNTDNNIYDYCCLNPPFGSSTVINEQHILNKYSLGKETKSQEIGILFIERSMNLLKENGIAFIIVPNGYLGNSTKNNVRLKEYIQTFKILSIIELPSNTFSRSGTGVSTSMIIIQKISSKNTDKIFIKKINNIGYILNKKNTPYKYKKNNGNIIIYDNKPILDDDLVDCYNELSSFVIDERIININVSKRLNDKYEYFVKSDISNNILDINRYLNTYKNIILYNKIHNYKCITEYIDNYTNTKFSVINNNEYLYLDIKQITSPTYNKTNYLYGYDLPQRAKIKVIENDIIISRLKGRLSFTVILHNNINTVCSNGFCLLRPKNHESLLILLSNLFEENFKIQHNSLCIGSIMASLTDNDIKDIMINPCIDINKMDNIINALRIINNI